MAWFHFHYFNLNIEPIQQIRRFGHQNRPTDIVADIRRDLLQAYDLEVLPTLASSPSVQEFEYQPCELLERYRLVIF